MLHLRPFVGRPVLRALFLASALLLAGGILSLVAPRMAYPLGFHHSASIVADRIAAAWGSHRGYSATVQPIT